MSPPNLRPLPSGDQTFDALNQIILDLAELHLKVDTAATRIDLIDKRLELLQTDINTRVSAVMLSHAASRTKLILTNLFFLSGGCYSLYLLSHALHLFGL